MFLGLVCDSRKLEATYCLPLEEQTNKMWSIQVMEYYTAVRGNLDACPAT